MNKKGTLTSRTLEKLGFVTSKFRSNSQPTNLEDVAQREPLADADKPQKAVNTITGGELDIPEEILSRYTVDKLNALVQPSQKKTLRDKLFGTQYKHGPEDATSSKSTFYLESDPILTIASGGSEPLNLASGGKEPLTKTLSTPIMKKKVQPAGTLEYTVKDTDTIQKVAAHFDTTPSELKKINKLVSSFIFAGQVLFVPDEDYEHQRAVSMSESDNRTSSTSVDASKERPTMDIPLIKAVNGPPAKVPGHVERQLTGSLPENGLDFEVMPHKLSVDEAEILDKECMERFIKLNVKHITDGQGVVKGVLLVTPNAVMFDPDVLDPLVIEHGAERYGMIAPMDLIISAAMYHDIAAMKMRNKRHDDGAMYQNKHGVYHDPNCPVYSHSHMQTDHTDSNKDNEQTLPLHIKAKLEKSLSECSCGLDDVFKDNDDVGDKLDGIASLDLNDSEAAKTDKTVREEAGDSVEKVDSDSKVESEQEDEATKSRHSKKGKKLSVSFSIQESDDTNLSDKAKSEPDVIDEESKTVSDVSSDKHGDLIQLDSDSKGSVEGDHSVGNQENTDSAICVETGDNKSVDKLDSSEPDNEPHVEVTDSCDTTSETNGDKETRIGSIVYLPVTEDQNGEITVKSIEQTQTTLSKLSADEFRNTSNSSDSNFDQSASKPEDKTDSSSTSALGAFSPTPHISAFVNYATGFFQKHSQDKDNTVKDVKEMEGSKVTDETKGKSFDIPMVGVAGPKGERRRVGKLGRNDNLADVEVENAVRMDEKSDLFTVDYKRYGPRASVLYHDPPLYLCLRMGTPQKHVLHNYSIESYGRRRKKSEYWFSIPREKVDHLYAFFVQWTPEIYGDEDDLTAEKRGFVVIEDNDQNEEDSLELLDDHFGPNSEFQKDWEIISKFEAERRQSIVYHEPLPLPDLIGVSAILDDDKVSELSQMMPGRTVGYPWTLIYSTETHGFSLKTLFREMNHLDSPILLVVKDINDNVFGALSSCELKLSDSFYGTGETFLYTFYPEFKVFHWTGENNFFVKGNNESLCIGAGQGLFGLWFDGDIYHGRTNRCDTFDNDILTASEDFIVKTFEAWAFIWD